jgi:hypothetical protein
MAETIFLIQFTNPRISQITLRNNKVVKFVAFLLNCWNTPSDPTATIQFPFLTIILSLSIDTELQITAL